MATHHLRDILHTFAFFITTRHTPTFALPHGTNNPHKFPPCTIPCIFQGYPSHYPGFRCCDLSNRTIIIACNVIFDETVFPFGSVTRLNPHFMSF
ncbi:hypothetical protein OSB04_024773 [Centaurea solstitialis]|uniref:Retroviral polymerase SH3-like domain-containing protein n=1 Tax=Centaurea solstitialis TaxID=347529 RepID=A0AA38SYG5_9ASTR|nr:hypothetical protein OSB04_024773 [Centaurea solstitialis]